jgi:CheY-like chemotaxis protein
MKKVLLIDDDPVTNFINKKLIERSGLEIAIVIAESGREGLDILLDSSIKREPFPDLIIVDVNMPVMNGFEFLESLHKIETGEFTAKKIAILSSSSSRFDKARAHQLGVDSYLTKPMEPATFLDLLS